MKDNLEYRVERERNAQLEAVAMMIKRRIMGYLQRKKYLKIRDDVIKIQKNYKVLYKLSALLSKWNTVKCVFFVPSDRNFRCNAFQDSLGFLIPHSVAGS